LQRHAGGGLQAQGDELLRRLDLGIGGVADHHAGRLESRRRRRWESRARQQRAHRRPSSHCCSRPTFEAEGLGFAHRVAHPAQGIGGHGRVVGVAALFVGFHDLQPLLQVAGEAAAGGVGKARQGAFAEHDQAGAGRTAPALLRRADQHIDADARMSTHSAPEAMQSSTNSPHRLRAPPRHGRR
jgi:hypothetical protein